MGCRKVPVVRRLITATIFFSVTALVGPALRWATWPSSIQDFFTPIQSFLYDLVFLIWPAQILWSVETPSSFSDWAENLFWSIGGNIFLYCILGVAAGALAKHRRRLLTLYLFVCAWELMIILYLKEFHPASHDLLAVAAAWLIYALPFWATAYFTRREINGYNQGGSAPR